MLLLVLVLGGDFAIITGWVVVVKEKAEHAIGT